MAVVVDRKVRMAARKARMAVQRAALSSPPENIRTRGTYV